MWTAIVLALIIFLGIIFFIYLEPSEEEVKTVKETRNGNKKERDFEILEKLLHDVDYRPFGYNPYTDCKFDIKEFEIKVIRPDYGEGYIYLKHKKKLLAVDLRGPKIIKYLDSKLRPLYEAWYEDLKKITKERESQVKDIILNELEKVSGR